MKPRHLLSLPFSRASLMSALSSLLSFLPKSNPSYPNPTNPNPRPNFVPRAAPDSNPNTNLPEEKRSLAVATGEIFLGLASLLIKSRADSDRRVGPVVSGAEVLNGKNDKVGVPSVIWEQSEKDVEAAAHPNSHPYIRSTHLFLSVTLSIFFAHGSPHSLSLSLSSGSSDSSYAPQSTQIRHSTQGLHRPPQIRHSTQGLQSSKRPLF